MSKILLTSGCSFSECLGMMKTWPKHLYSALQEYGFTGHKSSAMGSQGNGLISRGIVYNVTEALLHYEANDILVGVMWSNSNRSDYRVARTNLLSFGKTNPDGWIENPTSFVKDADKSWVIMNAGWSHEEAKVYYKYFFDDVGHTIYSLEHILRVQMFLQQLGIKYFFTNFTDNNIIDYTNVETMNGKKEWIHLEKLIDHNYYLPVSSCHRWLYDNSETKESYRDSHYYNGTWSNWVHPKEHHHKEFVDKVILPWLIKKQFI
jgi:hypothetical protein